MFLKMNKRNCSNYFSHAVNIKSNVIFWFMIYEINKTQRFNNKPTICCGFIKQMYDKS